MAQSQIEILIQAHSNAAAVIDADAKALKGLTAAGQEAGVRFARVETLIGEFGGTSNKAIKEATALARAIDIVGGVTKLTASEQATANKTIHEAIAKYTALGQTVPPNLQRIADATQTATKQTSLFEGSFTRLAAAFTAASLIEKGVTSLISYGREAFNSAGMIVDLSSKTGLSIETIQRMSFVAKQTSTSIDTFTNAAFNLGIRLTSGGSSVVKAVEALGLSYGILKAQSPEQQFNAITRALTDMESPQERNTVGFALFGRTFKEIAPAIEQGYADMAAAARVSSDEQIKAVDAAGDAWTRFLENSQTTVTSFIGKILLLTEATKKYGEDAFRESERSEANYKTLVNTLNEAAGATAKLAAIPSPFSVLSADGVVKGLPADLDAIEAALTREHASQVKAAAATDAHATALKTMKDRLSGAGLLRDAADLVKVIDQIGGVSKLTRAEMDQVNTTLSTTLDKYRVLGREAPDSLHRIWIATSRLADPTLYHGISAGLLSSFGKLPEEIDPSVMASIARIEGGLAGVPPWIDDIGRAWGQPSIKDVPVVVSGWGTALKGVEGILQTTQTAVAGSFAQMLLGAKGFGDGFVDIWQTIKRSVANIFTSLLGDFTNRFLKGILGALTGAQGGFAGAFSGLFGGGGGMLGGLLGGGGGAAIGSTGAFTSGAVGMGGSGGALGLGLSTAATAGIAAAVAGAIGLGMAVWKKGLFRGGEEALKVNPARDVQMAEWGGHVGLSDKLNLATQSDAETERLRKAFYDADSVKEYDAALKAINETLVDYNVKLSEGATTAQAAGEAEVAAADAAKAAYEKKAAALKASIADLETQQTQMMQSIADEAPEETMGVVEQQVRARVEELAIESAKLQDELAAMAKTASDETQLHVNASETAFGDLVNRGIAPTALAFADVSSHVVGMGSTIASVADASIEKLKGLSYWVEAVGPGHSPSGFAGIAQYAREAEGAGVEMAQRTSRELRELYRDTVLVGDALRGGPEDQAYRARDRGGVLVGSERSTGLSSVGGGVTVNVNVSVVISEPVDMGSPTRIEAFCRQVAATLGRDGTLQRLFQNALRFPEPA